MAITPYDIELGQGDTDYYDAVLAENGVAIDLEEFEVRFHMHNDGECKYNILCIPQTGNGAVPLSSGGIRIPFDSEKTAVAGEFIGKVYLLTNSQQTTCPTNNPLYIRIWEAV